MAIKKKKAAQGASVGALAQQILGEYSHSTPGTELDLNRFAASFPQASRYELAASLKELETAGAGCFTVGRKGRNASFTWGDRTGIGKGLTKSHAASKGQSASKSHAASKSHGQSKKTPTERQGNPPASRLPFSGYSPNSPTMSKSAVEDSSIDGAQTTMLQHSIFVRDGVLAKLSLPADITPSEIERLCKILQAIPF